MIKGCSEAAFYFIQTKINSSTPIKRFLTHFKYHCPAIRYILMSNEKILVFLPVQGHRLNINIFR